MDAYKYLSKIYDECMYDVNYGKWYGYIKSILDRYNVCGEIMETACGTGNITQYLAKDYDVIAVDSSSEMLEAARRKLASAGTTARLVCADMNGFVRDKKCSAVVSAMDGVNYLKDGPDSFFASAFSNLNEGGILVFDISSDYKLHEIIGDGIFYDDTDEYTYLWTNEYKGSFLYMDIVMFLKDGEKYIRLDEQHVQRSFSITELTEALKKAGFVKTEVYDFLTDKNPSKTSERIQFVAVK